MPFASVPYIQRHIDRTNRLPTYAIFVLPEAMDPALALHLSIVRGDMAIVEQWLRHALRLVTSSTLELAAASSQGPILRLLFERFRALATPKMMDLVAIAGDLTLLRWLHAAGAICTAAAMDGAAMNGHLDVVIFLHTARTEGCTIVAATAALRNGHAAIASFVLGHRAEGGVLPLLDYTFLHQQYKTHHVSGSTPLEAIDVAAAAAIALDDNVLISLVKSLGLPALMHLRAAGHMTNVSPSRLLHVAIVARDLPLLHYVLDHYTSTETTAQASSNPRSLDYWHAVDVAAFYGHLPTLEALQATAFGLGTAHKAMAYAAYHGHLHVLAWLHAHRTDHVLDDDALAMACVHGHLDAVRWLREVRHLSVTQDALATAAHIGHRRLVAYLLGDDATNAEDDDVAAPICGYDTNNIVLDLELHLCRSTYFTSSPATAASSQGHVEILERLVANGHSVYPIMMDTAVAHGHLPVVRYLHNEHGYVCTLRHICMALQNRQVELAAYLVQQCPRAETVVDNDDVQQLFVCAAATGHLASLQQLRAVFPAAWRPRTQELMLLHAALHGHVVMLSHLCEVHGLEWTKNVHRAATLLGRKKVLKYLQTRGPAAESVVRFARTARARDYYATLV
ncbi:hypothetical protein SDRG_12140 [Saprolegnia diclina VS20]|uniref:Uncharacterized protein n=1 Tax=Saprolegnia diclina (strain VS20) TaxID=1156394 RepID=T0PX41_SAPDV|nr:hypothetical protein SDRG_12140 [Saprolegnia diclina VS20]EQC30079.1 hypothetical protein SDRG_12140 [Saprolegnia diclina VS20]|eukprot:XP_008616422.1 hypothetical protein SDRG_12140 [Saprolegnia diclina VS20]